MSTPAQLLVALPWHAFTSPAEQWTRLPTFLLGEYAIMLAAVLAFVHAIRRDRAHLVVWFAALVAGTANDLIFMALPVVDNFWHAQATVMLTPRLPAYIPCMYVLFMYYPTVAISRLGMPRWSTAALAGLLATLTYAPFDIVGAKFIWWTWHDTDLPIRARWLGVPTSSTLWVLTFTGAFAWLTAPVLSTSAAPVGWARQLGRLAAAAATTPLMLLQMVPLQQLDGGQPGYLALGVGLVLYLGVALRRFSQMTLPSSREWLPFVAMFVYLGTLSVSITGFQPTTHVSEGVHETVGPCDVEATDITGAKRRAFLCVDDFDEDYDLAGAAPPAPNTRWYTICGRPFEDRNRWIVAVIGLCAAAAMVYARVFGRVRSR